MNAPAVTPRRRNHDDLIIDVRLACTRLGVLGSESQPDTAEIARTCEGLRRLLAEPTADEPEGIQ